MPLLGRDVVLVDALRSPFGRARSDGLYAHTRADDIATAVVRDLLRRHPELPTERIDEIAIAATSQVGDQGLTLGRTVGLLAGLPGQVPGYAIDRMCAGAMTAVTSVAAQVAVGAADAALAGGVEHMGHHPLGDRKSTRLNSSHVAISYAVFCLKKKQRSRHGATARR